MSRPVLPKIRTVFDTAKHLKAEQDQGRPRALQKGHTPPPQIPEEDIGLTLRYYEFLAPTEVFLAADTSSEWDYDVVLGRPWMVCWHVGERGDRFRVLEISDTGESWVYWGSYIKIMNLSDYDAIPLGTLSFAQRRALEDLAYTVPVGSRSQDGWNRQRWFTELILRAVGWRLFQEERSTRAVIYIEACPLTAREFQDVIRAKCKENAGQKSIDDKRSIVRGDILRTWAR